MRIYIKNLASLIQRLRATIGLAAFLGLAAPSHAGTVGIGYSPGAAVPALPVWGIAALAALVGFIAYREHKARNRRVLTGLFVLLMVAGGMTVVATSRRADASMPLGFTSATGGTLNIPNTMLNLSLVPGGYTVGTSAELSNLTGAPLTITSITVSGTCVGQVAPMGVYTAGSSCTVGTVLAPSASCHVAVYYACLV